MQQTYSSLFISELRKLIIEEADMELETLALGGGVLDYASYREKVGRIYGYRKVIELFGQAESNVEKRG